VVAAEDSGHPFSPPIGIETVFPVSLVREHALKELQPVENGYEIWGREIIKQGHIPVHFSTPVSYPWAYTEKGAENLIVQEISFNAI
jgi:hypothetical protein